MCKEPLCRRTSLATSKISESLRDAPDAEYYLIYSLMMSIYIIDKVINLQTIKGELHVIVRQ